MTTLAAVLAGLALLVWPRGRQVRAVRCLVARGRRPESHGPSSSRRWCGRRLFSRISLREPEGAGQWLPLLDELSAALGCGLAPVDALGMALSASPPTVRTALTPVLQAAREGRPGGPAWTRAARIASDPHLELLARSWAISEQLGAPLADGVDSAARAMRSDRDLSNRLAATTAGARTTANILTALPVAGVGVALMMGIGPRELYGSAVAMASLGCGLLLIGAGRLVVTRMIARAMVR